MSEILGNSTEKNSIFRGRMEALLTAVNESSRALRVLYITYLVLALYIAITLGATTDIQLLLNSSVVVPFLSNVTLPITTFYTVVPWVFLLIHFELLLHFRLLADKLHAFNEAVVSLCEDESRYLRLCFSDTAFIYWLSGGRNHLSLRKVTSLSVWVTLVLIPLGLLLAIQISFLPFHSDIITWGHKTTVVLDVLAIGYFWPRARVRGTNSLWSWFYATLLTRRFKSQIASNKDTKAFSEFPWLVIGKQLFSFSILVGSVIFSLGVAVLPEFPAHKGWTSAYWFFDRDGAWFHRNLDLREFVPEVDIQALRILRRDDTPPDIREKTMDGLVGLYLQDRNLRYVNWPTAFLINANLRGAHLEGAILHTANLQKADLREAHLEGAELYSAHLEGARLSNAHLEMAALHNANLEGANLKGAHMEGAKLASYPASKGVWRDQGAHLEGANLQQAHLEGIIAVGAHFEAADLRSAHLEGAILIGAHFEGANLVAADLRLADMRSVHFMGASLRGADVTSADFDNAHWQSNDLRGLRGWNDNKVLTKDQVDEIVRRLNIGTADLFMRELIVDRAQKPTSGFEPHDCLSGEDSRCENGDDGSVFFSSLARTLADLACNRGYEEIAVKARPYVARAIAERSLVGAEGREVEASLAVLSSTHKNNFSETERQMWQGLSQPLLDADCVGASGLDEKLRKELDWFMRWMPELPQLSPERSAPVD